VLLAIGGLAYLTGNFANFLSPAFAAQLFPYYLVFPGFGVVAPHNERERSTMEGAGQHIGGGGASLICLSYPRTDA
jgi:hypothetical protein